MTMKQWALKPGEFKPLDRCGMLLFAARCSLRVSAWWPEAAASNAPKLLEILMGAADGEPLVLANVRALQRAVGDAGAIACNRVDGTPREPQGRCHNYATGTLVAAIDAAMLADRMAVRKSVIDVAKYAASIPAVLGHAGQVTETPPPDLSAVDYASSTTWALLRADLAVVAAGATQVLAAEDRVAALRALAPLWPDPAPSWAAPR